MALRPPPPSLGATAQAAVPPVDFPALTLNVPPPPPSPATPGRDRNEAQLIRRVRELEEELRTVRSENEKQVRF